MERRSKININPNGRFSAALKRAIERQGISLTELAQKVDSTYEHMRKLVGGSAYPSRKLLPSLATVLRGDLDQWEECVEWDQLHKRYGGILSACRSRIARNDEVYEAMKNGSRKQRK